jgi:hypothetical protein
MGGTEMKWVWNQHKDRAVDIMTGNVLAIWEYAEIFGVRFEPICNGECVPLAEFDTLQAAQEFISNLTGAVKGGQL